MITTMKPAASYNHLNAAQKRTLQLFKKKLEEEMPKLRIAWAQRYNDTIMELHIDYDKHTYRKASKPRGWLMKWKKRPASP